VALLPEFIGIHFHIGGDEWFQVYTSRVAGAGERGILVFYWILASGFWILLL
jgi:hypothetical protein